MVESIVKFLAQHAIAVLMLMAGLLTSPRSLRRLRDEAGLFLRGLGVVWIAVPALAVLVVLAVRPPPIGGTTLMLMAVCPGVPMVFVNTRMQGGDVSTAVLMLALTGVTAPVLVPLWARVLDAASPYGTHLATSPGAVLGVLLPMVIAPLAIGIGIGWLFPRAAAILAKVAQVVFLVGLAILVVVVVRAGLPLLRDAAVTTYVALAVITFGAAVLGYVAGGPRTADAEAMTFVAVLGNPALALAIVQAAYPDLAAGALLAAYVIVRALLLIPVKLTMKARRGATPAPPRAPAPAPVPGS